MRKLLLSLLLANIIWSRPDGGVSITSGYTSDSRAEAARMLAGDYVPSDWEPVAYDTPITLPRTKRDTWGWDKAGKKIKEDVITPRQPQRAAPKPPQAIDAR